MYGKIPALTVLFLIGTFILVTPVLAANSNSKKRVISESTSVFNKILYRVHGCSIIHELNDATALECPQAVVNRYNLREDRVFQVVDLEADQQISADSVWTNYGSTGSNVVVAVLDTGVDYKHPELSNDIIDGMSFVTYTAYYLDDHGHGTHVAGIITADGIVPQAKGVAPDSKIWAGKVCSSTGSCWESDIATAIEWVVNNKIARILSISLGGGGTGGPNCDKDYLARKVNWASRKGVVVVVAAGNSGSVVTSPACASEAIAVGAVDKSDSIAVFSGRGQSLDILAPGVSIYSTIPSGYSYLSGTSMATPMVSGTAALLYEKNSSYSVSQIKSSLYNTALDLGFSSREQGNGRVNALLSYEYAPTSNDGDTGACPKGQAKKGLC